MPLVTRVRPRIGDVIEIPTPKGFAYAHFTHKDPETTAPVIRVLPGLFPERPNDFSGLVQEQPRFITMFPLGAACHRRIVCVVAAEPIPAHSASFPTFRFNMDLLSGKLLGPWSLWDGSTTRRVKTLTSEEFRQYPPNGIVNDTLLIERILSGWSHEKRR